MPFKKIGKNRYVSPSGRIFTEKQVRLYYATKGFKVKPRKSRRKSKKRRKTKRRKTARAGTPAGYRAGLSGRKIRSKGRGRGLGIGRGKGPIGRRK